MAASSIVESVVYGTEGIEEAERVGQEVLMRADFNRDRAVLLAPE
jgi:hypothetical protein